MKGTHSHPLINVPFKNAVFQENNIVSLDSVKVKSHDYKKTREYYY